MSENFFLGEVKNVRKWLGQSEKMSKIGPRKCKNVRIFQKMSEILSCFLNWTRWFRWAFQNFKILNLPQTLWADFVHFFASVNFQTFFEKAWQSGPGQWKVILEQSVIIGDPWIMNRWLIYQNCRYSYPQKLTSLSDDPIRVKATSKIWLNWIISNRIILWLIAYES